jgi:hypothetical protein
VMRIETQVLKIKVSKTQEPKVYLTQIITYKKKKNRRTYRSLLVAVSAVLQYYYFGNMRSSSLVKPRCARAQYGALERFWTVSAEPEIET